MDTSQSGRPMKPIILCAYAYHPKTPAKTTICFPLQTRFKGHSQRNPGMMDMCGVDAECAEECLSLTTPLYNGAMIPHKVCTLH